MNRLFQKVVIIGVGLIGGSLGLIIKQQGLAGTVIGIGRRVENLELAVRLGAIDAYESQAVNAVNDADCVILATPVDTYATHIREWGDRLPSGSIVSYVGSVKGALVEEAERLLPEHVRFVGAHPIAGREKSGVAYAALDLFRGARCLVTPTKRTDSEALEAVWKLWESTGSVVSSLDPYVHDFVLGGVSHLPHVAAFALMQALSELQGKLGSTATLLEYSGGGLRDTTRIAASSPEMWRDICLANRDNLLDMISVYIRHLEQFRASVENSDGGGLEKIIEQAKQAREHLQ